MREEEGLGVRVQDPSVPVEEEAGDADAPMLPDFNDPEADAGVLNDLDFAGLF